MVKSDAGARERVLYRRRDTVGVAVSRDRNRAAVVDLDKGGADVLSYGVGVGAFGNLTVLYVPPNRCLRPYILRLRQAGSSRRCI